MPNVPRVVFVGLGGAGQRHARVLRSLLGTDALWLGVRQRGTTPVLDASFAPRSESMADAYGLEMVPSLSAALVAGANLAVIATPTALHAHAVAEAVAAGCAVLVEKPLTATKEEAERLAGLVHASGVPVFVGFQRRLHPGWLKTADLISSGRLGSLLEASAWARSNVESWHPYEPIDGLYAVRRDLGGGAISTECHELDQAIGLWGLPLHVGCDASPVVGPNGVERSAEITLTYPDLGCPVRLSVSLESAVPQRGWRFVGTAGRVSWDEMTGVLEVQIGDDVTREVLTGYGNDDLVMAQDRWVLSALNDAAAAARGLAQAVMTSTVIAAAKQQPGETLGAGQP